MGVALVVVVGMVLIFSIVVDAVKDKKKAAPRHFSRRVQEEYLTTLHYANEVHMMDNCETIAALAKENEEISSARTIEILEDLRFLYSCRTVCLEHGLLGEAKEHAKR